MEQESIINHEPSEPEINWRFIVAVPAVLIVFLAIGITVLFYFGSIIFPSADEVRETASNQEEPDRSPYWINLAENSSLETISATSTTADPDWMLYRNEEYGFEVEIPTDWETMREYKTEKEIGYESVPAGSFKLNFPGLGDYRLEIVVTSDQFNDYVFEEYDDWDIDSPQIIESNGYTYFIIGQSNGNLEIKNHILKNFKTFNPSVGVEDVADLIYNLSRLRSYVEVPIMNDVVVSVTSDLTWSSYYNKKIGLEFEYPSDWTVVNKAFEDGVLESSFYSQSRVYKNIPAISIEAIPGDIPLEIYRRTEALSSDYEERFISQSRAKNLIGPDFDIDQVELAGKIFTEYIDYSQNGLIGYEFRVNHYDYAIFVSIFVPIDEFEISGKFHQTIRFD